MLSPELLLCASSHSHEVILVPTENSFFVFFFCTHQHKTGMKSNNETYKPSTCLMLLLSHCNFIWWEKLWNALFGYVYTCQSVKSTALLWSNTYLGGACFLHKADRRTEKEHPTDLLLEHKYTPTHKSSPIKCHVNSKSPGFVGLFSIKFRLWRHNCSRLSSKHSVFYLQFWNWMKWKRVDDGKKMREIVHMKMAMTTDDVHGKTAIKY